MGRTVALYAVAAAVLAWNWLRVEEHGHAGGRAVLIIALALAPALVPGLRTRVAVAFSSFILAAAVAFHLGIGRVFSGAVFSRFSGGFLAFYDYQLPFDGSRHPRMEGVVLIALFASCLCVGLAVAARRTIPAAVLLLVGAGWPATLLPGADLLRGAVLLAAVLLLVFALRAVQAPVAPAAVAAGVVVAVAVASSSALAGGGALDWQNWDFYTKAKTPVGVRYVWDSSFRGIRFPKKKTTVLRVKAGIRANYWRATSLDRFDGIRWRESLVPLNARYDSITGQEDLTSDPLVPASASDRSQWVRQEVTVVGLRDKHLVGASLPIAFASTMPVDYAEGGVAETFGVMRPKSHYTVWSTQPRPTPETLARSRPIYPAAAAPDLELAPGITSPAFGSFQRSELMRALFAAYRNDPRISPYAVLYRAAKRVVGTPRTPYGAAVGLEAWFRSGGGFRYDTQPPPVKGAPLAAFVTTSRRGYCQHFAGAMALMLRYLGIPARVAAGFTSGRYDQQNAEWVVTDHDAHTWVEAWFEGYGWLPFDPTPQRGTLTGSYTSASPTFDAGAALLALAARATGGRGASVLARLSRNSAAALNGRAPDSGSRRTSVPLHLAHHSRWPFVGLLFLLALGAAGVIPGTKLLLRRARYLTRDPRRIAAAAVRELSGLLLDHGVPVRRGMSVGEIAALAESELGLETSGFAAAASAARYGPGPGAFAAAEAARSELKGLRRQLREYLTRSERLRGRVSVRSLGFS